MRLGWIALWAVVLTACAPTPERPTEGSESFFIATGYFADVRYRRLTPCTSGNPQLDEILDCAVDAADFSKARFVVSKVLAGEMSPRAVDAQFLFTEGTPRIAIGAARPYIAVFLRADSEHSLLRYTRLYRTADGELAVPLDTRDEPVPCWREAAEAQTTALRSPYPRTSLDEVPLTAAGVARMLELQLPPVSVADGYAYWLSGITIAEIASYYRSVKEGDLLGECFPAL